MRKQHYPAIIVGGGPVGLVLALAMQQKALPLLVLEAREKGAAYQDKRALALSYGTKMILEKLEVWDDVSVHATEIQTIHVSQRGGLGRTKLEADEHDIPALGYVVSYGALVRALDKKLHDEHVIYEASANTVRQDAQKAEVTFSYQGEHVAYNSNLLVIAEGGRSLGDLPGVERAGKAYGHDALVSMVSTELPHRHIAYERFTPSGPMALLPNGGRDFSLVWTGEKTTIDQLLTLDDATFLDELHSAFGDRVGRFLTVGKRISFPLVQSRVKQNVTPHMVVIGNSAQTMHPVAGQGFNVGLRDAEALVKQLISSAQEEWGSQDMLTAYAKSRVRDTRGGLLFTDFLVSTFSNDFIGLSNMRSVGLGLLNICTPAKQFLVNKMSYGK